MLAGAYGRGLVQRGGPFQSQFRAIFSSTCPFWNTPFWLPTFFQNFYRYDSLICGPIWTPVPNSFLSFVDSCGIRLLIWFVHLWTHVWFVDSCGLLIWFVHLWTHVWFVDSCGLRLLIWFVHLWTHVKSGFWYISFICGLMWTRLDSMWTRCGLGSLIWFVHLWTRSPFRLLKF